MSDRDVSAADALDLVGLAGLDPEAVLFWTGAGITRDDPTCAPFGAELTERALGQFFEPLCLSRVRDYYRAMRIARDFPRLETVLDVINRVFGLDALADALSDLRHPPPNDLHAFFAQHLDAGGHQITANFDDCIERSVASTAPRTDRLIHFHGSFAADPTGADLGATFTNIQSGFAADVAEHLRATLTRRDAKAIVFAGYSGHDAFDVNPFLQTLAPLRELGGKTVVWIRFRPPATTHSQSEGTHPTNVFVGPSISYATPAPLLRTGGRTTGVSRRLRHRVAPA